MQLIIFLERRKEDMDSSIVDCSPGTHQTGFPGPWGAFGGLTHTTGVPGWTARRASWTYLPMKSFFMEYVLISQDAGRRALVYFINLLTKPFLHG